MVFDRTTAQILVATVHGHLDGTWNLSCTCTGLITATPGEVFHNHQSSVTLDSACSLQEIIYSNCVMDCYRSPVGFQSAITLYNGSVQRLRRTGETQFS